MCDEACITIITMITMFCMLHRRVEPIACWNIVEFAAVIAIFWTFCHAFLYTHFFSFTLFYLPLFISPCYSFWSVHFFSAQFLCVCLCSHLRREATLIDWRMRQSKWTNKLLCNTNGPHRIRQQITQCAISFNFFLHFTKRLAISIHGYYCCCLVARLVCNLICCWPLLWLLLYLGFITTRRPTSASALISASIWLI